MAVLSFSTKIVRKWFKMYLTLGDWRIFGCAYFKHKWDERGWVRRNIMNIMNILNIVNVMNIINTIIIMS